MPPGCRRKSRKPHHPQLADKIRIVYRVLVKHEHQKEVAKEERLSNVVISNLVSKARRNPKFLVELLHREEMKKQRRESIERVVR